MKGVWFSAAAILPFAVMSSNPAFAQGQAAQGADADAGGIAEIVVTAQKRAENVQDVPIAISAFTSEALQERAVGDVSQLSGLTPNVTLDASTPFSGSGSVLAAYIRGIGSNDFAFNIDPGVGVYLDGVYLARTIGANQDMLDVERVEVLKGPQGTLFGRNTIGGAISIVTRDPGRDFRLRGDVTTGSYGLFQARVSVDAPITSSLSSSFTVGVKTRKGYMKRLPFPGADAYHTDGFRAYDAADYDLSNREGGDDAWNGRVKLVWDNGGRVRLTLSGDYYDQDQSATANSLLATRDPVFAGWYNACISNDAASLLANPATSFLIGFCSSPRVGVNGINELAPLLGSNVVGDPNYNPRLPYDDRFVTGDRDTSYANGNSFSKLRTYGVGGTIDIDLSDDVSLKSITAYREMHFKFGIDLDGSPVDILHISENTNQWQFSQEVQLLGKALDNSLNYVLGAYYFEEAGDIHDYVTFPLALLQVDGPNDLKTKNYAFFGQIDWRPIDLIGITLGGRYTREKKNFEGFQSDLNGGSYKQYGFDPIDANRIPLCDLTTALAAAGTPGVSPVCFPNAGQPLRYYIAGVQHKKFSNFSPKVGVQIHPNDDVMAYASWSKGYKTGGWTTRLSNPLPYAPGFEEEKATTWEIGVKTTLLDRRLQLNAAAFTTDYKGIQLNFQQGVSPVVQNAGDARIRGFEFEMVAAPFTGLTLNGSVGYIDSYYTAVDPAAQVYGYANGPCAAPAGAVGNPDQIGVCVGATLPKTPHWKFNISPRYELNLGNDSSIVLLADYTHTSGLKNDTEGTLLLNRGATDMVNASVTYRLPGGNWELTAGGTNLTNKRYLVTGQYQAAGGVIYGTYNRPAEWYVRLGMKF